ncbi:hypothetical protein TRFO_36464 [Tritrichomonas foetus]|uniref:Ubiquitin-like domain-containing protein n=1 Tax=Tritrichomonas foetus TaxID=1144522 RepID=A0A1J4JGC0_9EUKA|nr:hypothetical protein TRFO_36464 [Tritrichomonas foetus]|eukprot:OHS97343.1 hypothetical protein TRFO_36464 [Tritrichomonas foetus]
MFNYNEDLIQSLIIQSPQFDVSLNQKAGSNNLRLTIQASIQNPEVPGQRVLKTRFQNHPSTTPIQTAIKEFQKTVPEVSDKNLLIYYNNILYEDGTLESCHIQNDSILEIVALKKDKLSTENEGFRFVFWALIPLLISFSFLGAGLIGRFKMIYRAIYVLLSTIIGVPAAVFSVLGFVEQFSGPMKAAIVGQYWFGPHCFTSGMGCNNLFGLKDEKPVDNIDVLIQNMNNAINEVKGGV